MGCIIGLLLVIAGAVNWLLNDLIAAFVKYVGVPLLVLALIVEVARAVF